MDDESASSGKTSGIADDIWHTLGKPRTVSSWFGKRCKLLLYAWGIAFVVAGFPNLDLLLFFVCFPKGLEGVLSWLLQREVQIYDTAYLYAWAGYIAATLITLLSSKRILFYLFYTLLCIVLALNAVGCRTTLHGIQ